MMPIAIGLLFIALAWIDGPAGMGKRRDMAAWNALRALFGRSASKTEPVVQQVWRASRQLLLLTVGVVLLLWGVVAAAVAAVVS
jgi:hypothetical protein